jgi:hypothetical protein
MNWKLKQGKEALIISREAQIETVFGYFPMLLGLSKTSSMGEGAIWVKGHFAP